MNWTQIELQLAVTPGLFTPADFISYMNALAAPAPITPVTGIAYVAGMPVDSVPTAPPVDPMAGLIVGTPTISSRLRRDAPQDLVITAAVDPMAEVYQPMPDKADEVT